MSQPLNLIDKAIEASKTYRQQWKQDTHGITEPLTPDSVKQLIYLRVRESLNRGCRETVKQLSDPYKRSIAYSIIMQATYDIFHYGKTTALMTFYNRLLDETVGVH